MSLLDWRARAARIHTLALAAICVAGLALASSVADAATPPVKINYQPASVPVPAGYLPDAGLPFAARGNGYSYGWKANGAGSDLSSSTRDRNDASSIDQRYDTLIAFSYSTNPYWEIALPNGKYSVRVTAGDPTYYTGHTIDIDVEGLPVVDGVTNSVNRFPHGTRTITLTDGALTLSSGPLAINNVVSFVDITPVVSDATPPETAVGSAPPAVSSDKSPTFLFTANEVVARYECRIDGTSYFTCPSDYTASALPDGSHVLEVRAVDGAGNVDPTPAIVNFKIDTDPPSLTLLAPANNATVPTSGVTRTFTSDEPSTFYCSTDVSEFTPCVSGSSTGALATGAHKVSVAAVDAAGNYDLKTAAITASSGATGATGSTGSTGGTGGTTIQAIPIDHGHVELRWSGVPAFALAVVARDGVVVGRAPAGSTTFRDAQLWFSTAYRYTVTFWSGSGSQLAALGPVLVTTPKMPNPSATMPNGIFPVEYPNSTLFSRGLYNRPDTSRSGAAFSSYLRSHVIYANLTLRRYGVPVYEAHAGDPTIKINGCGYGGCTLNNAGPIPFPFDAYHDSSPDEHLTIVSRQQGYAWDFFKPDLSAPGVFRACGTSCPATQAGAITSLASNGMLNNTTSGANAANIASLAGLIRPEEIAQGRIDHAVMISMPGIGTDSPRCPATKSVPVRGPLASDSVSASAPPEGTLYKLDPYVDIAALPIPSWQKTVAKAMMDYGAYIRDNGGALSVYAETSTATLGGRHYDGWDKTGIPEFSSKSGYPASAPFSSAFPWDRLITQLPPC